jgi:tRNA threonylcarbamoyladenosine biosynthesis protein TsaB
VLILTIRTDKPEAEIGLFDGNAKLDYEIWHAHRELSVTIHQKIAALLQKNNKTLEDLAGIVAFSGPGSFTGLRIGLTVADTMAYGLQIPIVGAKGEDWTSTGCKRLLSGENVSVALPEYGALPNITQQKK